MIFDDSLLKINFILNLNLKILLIIFNNNFKIDYLF